jgi:threonine-phosphate decarboxylase
MGDDYIRISVRPKNDIDRLIKEIGIAIVDSAREKAINELADSLLSPDFSATGSNRNCPYYPCHFPDQDCTFCFCPFYPCGEEKTGGKWVERSSGGNVWSCEGCELVHHPDTAEKLIYELKGNSPMEEKLIRAWNRVVEPIL